MSQYLITGGHQCFTGNFLFGKHKHQHSAGGNDGVNLGTMTVSSGNSTTVEVVLKLAKLSDLLGNAFTLDPYVSSQSRTSVNQSGGSQDIILNGTANLAAGQASGLYSSPYTVIFAYN